MALLENTNTTKRQSLFFRAFALLESATHLVDPSSFRWSTNLETESGLLVPFFQAFHSYSPYKVQKAQSVKQRCFTGILAPKQLSPSSIFALLESQHWWTLQAFIAILTLLGFKSAVFQAKCFTGILAAPEWLSLSSILFYRNPNTWGLSSFLQSHTYGIGACLVAMWPFGH